MPTRDRYRQTRDLYRKGAFAPYGDDLLVWLQVLNGFEQDDVRQHAMTARARRIMALSEHDEDAMARARAEFLSVSREEAERHLLERVMQDVRMKVLRQLHTDPEWEERLRVVSELESDDVLSRPADDPERKLLVKTNEDYLKEMTEAEDRERKYITDELAGLSDEDLQDRWITGLVDAEGTDAFQQAYTEREMLLAARACDATVDDGVYSCDSCSLKGEQITCRSDLPLWESVADLRDEADELYQPLVDAMQRLNVSITEAKG